MGPAFFPGSKWLCAKYLIESQRETKRNATILYALHTDLSQNRTPKFA